MPVVDFHARIKYAFCGVKVKVFGPGKVDVPEEVAQWYKAFAKPSITPKSKAKIKTVKK